VKFWDASAIVPLLVAEVSTRRLLALAGEDPAMLVWWGSEVECTSALARVEREAAIDANGIVAAFSRLKQLKTAWHEINPSDAVRESAHAFFVCTRCVPPMRCNSPPPSLRQKVGRHHWSSSAWTIASARLLKRKASPWSRLSRLTEG
jgi:hypothetical protein